MTGSRPTGNAPGSLPEGEMWFHHDGIYMERPQLASFLYAILEKLFAIGEDPSVVYEHVWTVGDFVMWDNLCSMHARTDFPAGERRLLRRCVIEGTRPEA